MEKVKYCPNCESNHIEHFIRVPDRHYGIKGEFNNAVCYACSLVFLDPMPNEEELSKFYPEDSYYSFHVDINYKEPLLKRLIKSIFLLNIKTKDPKFYNPGKILDIGCGNGWTLNEYKQKGWEVAGVEPSETAAKIGNKAGLNIHSGNLLSANYDDNRFDYIRSNHSFEHIPNPNEVLSEVFRILKSDGKLFIGVPNINGINSKLFKAYWYYLGAPVHTFNYSPSTLTSILEKNGFKVKKVTYNSNYAGILGSIQIYLNRNKNLASDKGFVYNFIPFRIIASIIAKIENLFRIGDCMELIAEKKE